MRRTLQRALCASGTGRENSPPMHEGRSPGKEDPQTDPPREAAIRDRLRIFLPWAAVSCLPGGRPNYKPGGCLTT